MSEQQDVTQQSKECWEAIAGDWDTKMGDTDNRYHREIIRPATLKLLDPQPNEQILDAACGNGNFSRFLANLGVRVTAFDYSPTLIACAQTRCSAFLDRISFHTADATDYSALMALGEKGSFDKAVSNMAVMDISDVEPLFQAVYDLLKPNGIFVFSGVHPCFQTPNMRKFTTVNDYTRDDSEPCVQMGIQTYEYIKPRQHEVTVFVGNRKRVLHFHRPLSQLLNLCFACGFVLDGMEEPVFKPPEHVAAFDWYEIPPSIIVRLRKLP